MATLEEVKNTLRKLEPKLSLELAGKAEVAKIPSILLQGETIEAVTKGALQKNEGVLLATNHRIIYIDSTSWTPYPYVNLSGIKYRSSIEFKDGGQLGGLMLDTTGEKVTFKKVPSNGANFAKAVNNALDYYEPDSRYSTEESHTATSYSVNKKLLVIVPLLLLCVGLVYFALGMGSKTASSAPTLSISTEQFQKQWNQAATKLESPFQMTELQVVSNDEKRSFTYYLTESMKLTGMLSDGNELQKLIMLGQANDSLPLLAEQTLAAIHPDWSPEANRKLLEELGISDGEISNKDRQIVKAGIRYSITFSDQLGIIFEVAKSRN